MVLERVYRAVDGKGSESGFVTGRAAQSQIQRNKEVDGRTDYARGTMVADCRCVGGVGD